MAARLTLACVGCRICRGLGVPQSRPKLRAGVARLQPAANAAGRQRLRALALAFALGLARRLPADFARFHSALLASAAPMASDVSFAHWIDGCTRRTNGP